MSRTATYHTTVTWKGDHWGHLVMGNGPQYMFSAPPDAHGHAGVLTPEEAKERNVPIIAPEGFVEEATSENIIAGVTMGRRSQLARWISGSATTQPRLVSRNRDET